MSKRAVARSAWVDAGGIESSGGLGGKGRSERSGAGPFDGVKWVVSSSKVDAERRIAKTLPDNLDLGFQNGMWVLRLQMVEV